MADETRTIIIDIDAEEQDFDQAIGEVNTELKKNSETLKELRKDYGKNATEIAKLEQENKKLSASKRQLSKESDIQSNSLNALRNELAKQVKERNNLNTSTDEGVARFKQLQTSIKGLGDEIKGFEEEGGDFRRSVGNYPQQFGEAVGGINIFGTSLSGLFKLILANPFLLIIGAITSLIAVFAKSQTGIEFFRTASAVLNTTLAKLADVVEFLGASMIDAFESPQETLNSLVDTIRDGVFRYFNEFIPNAITKVLEGFGLLAEAVKQVFEGDFDAALDTATEGVTKLVDGLTDINPATALIKAGFEAALPALIAFGEEVSTAASIAGQLETQLIANEKAQADLDVRRAESLKTLKELNLLIEDTTKSDEERLAAADAAAEIEEGLLNERLRLKREEVDIIKAQNELANSTEEDIQRRRDAEIEFFTIEAESLERSTTLQNKRNTIVNAQRAKEEKDRLADIARIKKEDADKKKRDDKERKEDLALAKFKTELGQKGLADTAAILGQESALGRTAAIAEIASNAAKGVSAAIASGAKLPFPANLGAIASGVASVLAGILQARNLISGGGGGVSIASTDSGINAGLATPLNQRSEDVEATRNLTVEAVASVPAPIVSVVDINEATDDAAVVVSEATL